jgi:hypothetical protein
MNKLSVVSLSPHIPVDELVERSAYSILLLHTDWGSQPIEHGILSNDTVSAVVRLAELKSSLPVYVLSSLSKTTHSQAVLKTTGNPLMDQTTNLDDDLESSYLEVYKEDQRLAEENDALFDGVIEEQPPSVNLFSSRILRNTPRSQYLTYHNYTKTLATQLAALHKNTNSLSNSELASLIMDPNLTFNYNNYESLVEELRIEQAQLSCFPEQIRCFETVVKRLTGQTAGQMIMFVSGEGGTGKSKIIHTIRKFCQCYFGRTEGKHGPILLTAPTGSAASNINGATWQSVLHQGRPSKRRDPSIVGFDPAKSISAATTVELQLELRGVRIFVLDEISLLNLEGLYEISCRLCVAMNTPLNIPFGGMHVILAGDFYQMISIGGTSMVEPVLKNNKTTGMPPTEAAKKGFHIFREQITDYILLTENVRAKGNNGEKSQLAKFCSKARVGDLSSEDLAVMNTRRFDRDVAMQTADPEAIWITSTHNEIERINKDFRDKMLAEDPSNTPINMIARHVPVRGTVAPDCSIRDILYAHKGATHGPDKGLQSSLLLQVGTRVRVIDNIAVSAGLFNGSMGTVYGFVYLGNGPTSESERNPKCKWSLLEDNQRELPIVLVRMDGIDDPDINKCTFPFTCDSSVTRLIPIVPVLGEHAIHGNYYRMQLPLAIAHARTCHSMQGHTAEHGVVVDVGSMFFAGDYVSISRARHINQVMLLGYLLKKYFPADRFLKHMLKIHELYALLKAKFPCDM